jgi:Pyruvate/2-oxoacid:ferredoxin oxidoreductase delta subunit
MALRNIIEIDEEKCDGCGLCVTGCAEGALQVVDGKARLVSEVYCDGLGACLAECPNDALQVVEREAESFDEKAVEEHLADGHEKPQAAPAVLPCGCPGSQVQELKPFAQTRVGPASASSLTNWPVQLHLVPTRAPFFKEASLLIAADCAGFTLTNLHERFLPGRALIIACPKLDETGPYEGKLEEIFRENNIKEITLLYMTVPCCGGLVHLVREALAKSGKSIPLRLVRVDPTGEVVRDERELAA